MTTLIDWWKRRQAIKAQARRAALATGARNAATLHVVQLEPGDRLELRPLVSVKGDDGPRRGSLTLTRPSGLAYHWVGPLEELLNRNRSFWGFFPPSWSAVASHVDRARTIVLPMSWTPFT